MNFIKHKILSNVKHFFNSNFQTYDCSFNKIKDQTIDDFGMTSEQLSDILKNAQRNQ